MADQKIIDDLSEELDGVSRMGGDVDSLKSSEEEEETLGEEEDTEEETSEEEEPTSEEEDDDSEEDEEEEEKPLPKPKPKVADPAKAHQRINKSRGKLRTEIDEIKSSVSEILKAIKSGALSKADGAEAVKDEIDLYAEKHKLDPAGVRELADILQKRIAPKTQETEDEESDDDLEDEAEEEIPYNAEEEAKIFDEEWTPLEEKIREQYPNATPKQIVAAKRKMDELSHSSVESAQQELDYIFNKNVKVFKELLFSPKKKGAESGFLGTVEDGADDKGFQIPKELSPKKAAELEAMLDNAADEEDADGIEIMRDGEKIRT